eukprot:TRINITY_DN7896_c0_g1_i1.p1 TRINITY_DN7896_c0_g1~~TRINITY_DN7896_c0_g1_i1.p1  ORF type:complete len:120 (+),score=1.14 TRINITY_DN7896_c0_g1_i1:62-421(+)
MSNSTIFRGILFAMVIAFALADEPIILCDTYTSSADCLADSCCGWCSMANSTISSNGGVCWQIFELEGVCGSRGDQIECDGADAFICNDNFEQCGSVSAFGPSIVLLIGTSMISFLASF